MRLVDFFFALRPLVLVPAWSFFLLGHGLARAGTSGTAPALPGIRLLLLSGILASVYLVNQVVDFESDRINGKGFFLQRGLFARSLYVGVATASVLVALGAAVVLREEPLWLAAAAFLGLAYSVAPLRLAARPGFDLAANALGYGGIALRLGAGPDIGPDAAPWALRFAAASLAVAAVFLHTTLLDLEGDRRTGKRTSGVALGAPAARALATVLTGVAIAAAARAAAPVLLGASVVVALLCVAAWVAPARFSSRTVCMGASAAFVVAAAVYVPLFLVAVALLAALTRIYYRRRFALAYPAL